MKIWATSCLHLRPENLADRLAWMTEDLELASEGDCLLLMGDIVDATPGWRECEIGLAGVLTRKGMTAIWLTGNNDNQERSDWLSPLSSILEARKSKIRSRGAYLNQGVNVPSLWAHFHDRAQPDQIRRFYNEVIFDCAKEDVRILGTHFPFLSHEFWHLSLTRPPPEFWAALPGLQKIVFGHVHEDYADVVPKEATLLDGRRIPIHLVSDHRKNLVHLIQERS